MLRCTPLAFMRGPSHTASTAASSASMVMTTSASIASAGSAATRARSPSLREAAGLRFQTTVVTGVDQPD